MALLLMRAGSVPPDAPAATAGRVAEFKKIARSFDEVHEVSPLACCPRRAHWIACQPALMGLVGLALGCTAPNTAYDGVDARPDVAEAPVRVSPDAGSIPDMSMQDGQPDLPSPSDVPGLADVVSEQDVPADPAMDAVLADVPASRDVALPDVAPDVLAPCTPVMGTGTGVTAEYFDNSDFTGTRVTRTDPTIDWDFGTGSADPSLDADNFSARWTGQLQAIYAGPHTFVASYDDGMRMFLDERVVMYRWGPRLSSSEDRATVVLEAGRKYDLRFEFYDQGSGATARLAWESPCHSRQVVPRKQLYPVAPAAPVCLTERAPGAGTGLKVQYFPAGNPGQTGALFTGLSPRVDFEWGSGAPASGVATDFSSRWTGTLEAPIDGPLTVYLSTDDVGRLRLDGKTLTESWAEPFGPQEIAATVDVRAGQRYDLVIEHRDDKGGALAHLYWSWPCHPREIVPTNRLYPAP
jgi:hypothetical protein